MGNDGARRSLMIAVVRRLERRCACEAPRVTGGVGARWPKCCRSEADDLTHRGCERGHGQRECERQHDGTTAHDSSQYTAYAFEAY
jgi:hypothetical protein